MTSTQNNSILAYLKSGKELTALDALMLFGCFRLSARIKDIKEMGYKVEKQMIKLASGKRVAKYYMEIVS